jgi:hypothetical protein
MRRLIHLDDNRIIQIHESILLVCVECELERVRVRLEIIEKKRQLAEQIRNNRKKNISLILYGKLPVDIIEYVLGFGP